MTTVTAQWTPGIQLTRRYPTTEEAMVAIDDLLSDRSAAKWNPNGALIKPDDRNGWWVRGPRRGERSA